MKKRFVFRWFYAHSFIQLVISGPVIWAGWSHGYNTAGDPHFTDIHGKIGLALLILYTVQLVWGLVIHFFKTTSLFKGHRPPQNHFHIILGIIVLCLAHFQVGAHVSLELNMVRIAAGANSMLKGVLWIKYRVGENFRWISYRSQICDERLDCAHRGECDGNPRILGKSIDGCYLDFLDTLHRRVCFAFFSKTLAREGGKGDNFNGKSLH